MIVFPNKYSFRLTSRKTIAAHSRALGTNPETIITVETVEEADAHKRTFLRLAGLLGVGVVATSMLPKKAEAYILGGSPTSAVVGSKNSSNVRVNPATEDTLETVAGQTSKLSFDGSNNLYVQAATNFSSQLENSSNAVINPATEDSLAAIKTQTNKFTFSAGALVTTSSGGGGAGGTVAVEDTTSTQINPATEDSIILLRRMVKLMESQAAVDSGNRQRITLDSLGTGTAITTTLPVSGTVAVSSATLAAGAAQIGSVYIDGQGRQMFQDSARTAYATGIRQNLTFV